jgi:hypothetical protein
MRRSPSSESTTAHRVEGVLAHPRRASQLRDSAGLPPDFASQTAPGRTRDAQRSAKPSHRRRDGRPGGKTMEAGTRKLVPFPA